MKNIWDFPLHDIRRKVLRLVSAGLATENIYDEVVDAGYMQIITRVSIENETSAFTQFRLGIMNGGYYHLLEEQKNPAAATLYWTSDPIWLSEGDRLRVELKGCTLNDIIKVYIDGFEGGL